ncbi:ABC transporter ATP-binding protein [Desulfonema ishimotonii]|uniref:ABC transporter ATP-binding protein n=1 Tax=Desulfonema ishimotonii TaxID=45657 RepID=UPI001E3A4ED2|nr:ABC transporter ATP-binding protein [Desulfonema ishimotonii]
MEIEPGYFYGILGPNGCGKSTTIDLLMGHRKPGAGTITYKGRDLFKYPRRELAREMALVPQNFYINFPFTGREIVVMGRYPHMPRFSAPSAKDLAVADTIMERTGTAAFKERYMTEMSGGERQRVVFARALVQETPVLMLDEATSNLDVNHTLKLMDIVSEDVRNRGRTVIAVIQDINLAATYCDRLILMKDGYVAAFGKTGDVLNTENIRSVFGVDSHVWFDTWSESKKVSFKRNNG